VDTFSGWTEAFPTSNNQSSTIAIILIQEIIPHFGLPTSIQCDNGPEFTSSIPQEVAKYLQITWKFHIPYHPQSSGKVECTNQTLKHTITKLCLEIHQDWIKLFPLALLKLQTLPPAPPHRQKKRKNPQH
jgi:transposase InsO family protein